MPGSSPPSAKHPPRVDVSRHGCHRMSFGLLDARGAREGATEVGAPGCRGCSGCREMLGGAAVPSRDKSGFYFCFHAGKQNPASALPKLPHSPFFVELVTQWSSDPTEINSTAMRHVVKR